MTCGVSLLVRLARAGRCDLLTRGVTLGLSGEVPTVISASTIAMGDDEPPRKAEWMLLTGEDEGEGLLEVSAAASASSSAGEDSTLRGEERCWLVTGAPLMVTCRDSALCIRLQYCCKTSSPCGTGWKCKSCNLPAAPGMHEQHTQIAFACNTRHQELPHYWSGSFERCL